MTRLDLERIAGRDHVYAVGGGRVARVNGFLRLTVGPTTSDRYADAQLDDYHCDGRMRWRSPLQLDVRARFSHAATALHGTAGFGFWNDPLGMTGRLRLRLPQAAWFIFSGAESDMPWCPGVSGHGWKAATVDAGRSVVPFLLPGAPLLMLLMRRPWLQRRLWPPTARLLGIHEVGLSAPLDGWHDYRIIWRHDSLTFSVDGQAVLNTESALRGPLGLVVWMDNQYMIATPQGRFVHGAVALQAQWLELSALDLTAPI